MAALCCAGDQSCMDLKLLEISDWKPLQMREGDRGKLQAFVDVRGAFSYAMLVGDGVGRD